MKIPPWGLAAPEVLGCLSMKAFPTDCSIPSTAGEEDPQLQAGQGNEKGVPSGLETVKRPEPGRGQPRGQRGRTASRGFPLLLLGRAVEIRFKGKQTHLREAKKGSENCAGEKKRKAKQRRPELQIRGERNPPR